MPVVETQIQHREVMPFFCRREEEGGLGYRETEPNIISDDLFIPSQLKEFVSKNSPRAWSALRNKYNGDETALVNALKEEIKRRIIVTSNVATFFNSNKSITFEGENITLFYVSGTETTGDADFNKNIFSAVEEMSHTIRCDGMKIETVRPDISFFLNGIFFGYMELKSVTNGQNAKDDGRGKVIGDYLECVKFLADRAAVAPECVELSARRQTLYLFMKGIHITACDINETYVIRNIDSLFDDAKNGFQEGTASFSNLRPMFDKIFKLYPITSELLSENQRFEEVMKALYSKKMIEKEILFYNFNEYQYKRKGNRKVVKDNTPRLVSPRPKQKFGCDKIMNRVREMLEHENEPDYYQNILRRQLQALNVPTERIDEIIAQRDRYCNNKYVYSLLMQYAAGFGKSNIIGWTALQLKGLRHQHVWAFDKIMIVVDRLQLRGQLDTMMMSMNIDKSMFTEVRNQDQFIAALTDNRRIIVVNIQKFLDLQNAIQKSGKTLKQMRVAFLIDEIHRSNTGESNKEMVNLFEKLQDSINDTAKNGVLNKKKNLIIGFTATPTEKVLARFGEFKSASIIPTWVPFDAYTMKEAIEDGYILDPTKHIIPVVSHIHFEVPEDYDPTKEQDIDRRKEDIYGNQERMEQIAHFIVNRLVSQVYGKIRGTGKAMLAVSSIPNAINYCNAIRKLMKEKCADPLYRRYADAPISIVYSDNQKYESSASMNNQEPEEKVIENFQLDRNGLMIVVDKLQTGFDEKHLHTLFLDKEIKDINAIQTISRVNRTMRHKHECQIVDFSWQNVNVENIRTAFKKYCGINTSNFNPDEEAKRVEMLYKELCKSEPFRRWFADYRKLHDDTSFVLTMEDGIRQWIRVQFEHTKQMKDLPEKDSEYMQVVNGAIELRKTVGYYGAALANLEDVLDIDKKYRDGLFLIFWEIYCRILRDFFKVIGGTTHIYAIVEGDDEIPGITISAEENVSGDDDEPPAVSSTSTTGKSKEKAKNSVLEIIQKWNEGEMLSQQEVQKWLEEIGIMFEAFRKDSNFIAVIKDDVFSPEEKLKKYMTVLTKYKFSLNKRQDLEKVQLFKKLLDDNKEQLLDVFIESLMDAEEKQYTFDFSDGQDEK